MPHEQNNLLNAVNPQHSAVVEACAGSGKTWLLTARMLRYLLEGGAIYQMVAITFTRKAAAEMLERLTSLSQQLKHASDDEVDQIILERGLNLKELADEQAQQYHQRARGLYQQLQHQSPTITTFHSWFFNVLQRAPLEFGSFEGITLLESDETLLYDVWQQWLIAIGKSEHSNYFAHWQSLIEAIDINELRELLFQLARHPSEWHSFNHDAQLIEWQQQLHNQQAELARLIDQRGLELWIRRWIGCWATGTDKEQSFANELLDCLNKPLWFEAFKDLALTSKTSKKSLKKPTGKNAKNAVIDNINEADIRQMIQHAVDQQINFAALQQSYTINQHLNALAKLWFELITQEKQRQHVLTFTDLEYKLFRLIKSPYIATLLTQQAPLQHLLIDEFQDTNPVQWAIVKALLQEYRDAALPVSVFLVGDPKQSIYRFRRANPEIFSAARQWLIEHQQAQTFFANSTRRLSQTMVQRINQLFNQQPSWPLFSPHQSLNPIEAGALLCTPIFTKQKSSSTTQTDNAADDASANEEDVDSNQDDAPIELARQEAQFIASSLKQLMNQGLEGEPLKGQDILILTKDRKNWNTIESALKQADLSVQREQKTSLWHTLEGIDFLAWLRVVYQGNWHQQTDISLLTLLKSPYLRAFDGYHRERELLILLARAAELRQEEAILLSPIQAAWQSLAGESIDNPWASSWQTIEHWRTLAQTIGLHELFDAVVCDTNLYAAYARSLQQHPQHQHQTADELQPLLDQQLANLSRLIELTLSSMDASGHSAEAWLAELDQRFLQAAHTGDNKALLESSSLQANADSYHNQVSGAIRLLTIHEAKGLEAPVIWLADCARKKKNDDHLRLLIDWPAKNDAPQQFCILAGKKTEHSLIAPALLRDQQQAEQETWNLLYVAATRAKQVLIVSGHSGKAQKDTVYQRIFERCSAQDLANPLEQQLLSALNNPQTSAIVGTMTETSVNELNQGGRNAENEIVQTGTASLRVPPNAESACLQGVQKTSHLKLYQQSVVSEQASQLLQRRRQIAPPSEPVHIHQRYGTLWHALLESALCYLKTLKTLPTLLNQAIDWQAHWQAVCVLHPDAYALNQTTQIELIQAASRVLQLPIWQTLWHENLGESGRRVEQAIVDSNGKQHRLDVLVIQEDLASTNITVIDFKWQVDDQNLASYREQLQRYSDLLQAMFAQASIDKLLIDANANVFR